MSFKLQWTKSALKSVFTPRDCEAKIERKKVPFHGSRIISKIKMKAF